MIKSCDSGSMPPFGDSAKFLEGANSYCSNPKGDSAQYFETVVVESFLDKLNVNLNVPNYPQFRDMNEMFFSMMNGIQKVDASYLETEQLSLKSDNNKIAEVLVLENNAKTVYDQTAKPFEARVCITGPYTLASFFPYRDDQIFGRLADVLSKILETNLFSNKCGKTSLVSVDEPLFGLLDDPSIDFGSAGKENLHRAWETICKTIRNKGAQTMIHLHNTSNELFWDVDSLQLIDSHVGDPLLSMNKTKQLLETKDKFLKSSITVNDFDRLIKSSIEQTSQDLAESEVNQKIADTWTEIKRGKVNPDLFLDSEDLMKKRLAKTVDQFGEDRVLYAGPECGLKGYPTYKNALECLRRVSSAVKSFQ